MYKQILFYLMLIDAVSRTTAITLLAVLDRINLPVSVVLLSAFLALLGIILVIRRLVKGLKLLDLTIYHITAIFVTILSFFLLRFYPSDISMIETLITGSVLSLLLSVTFLILAMRKKRYITIQRRLEEEMQQTVNQDIK